MLTTSWFAAVALLGTVHVEQLADAIPPAGAVMRFRARAMVSSHVGSGDAGVNSLAFAPDGKLLAAASSQGGCVMLWDVPGKKPRRVPLGLHYPSVGQFSADGKQLWFYVNAQPHVEILADHKVAPRSQPAAPNGAVYWTPTCKTWIRHVDADWQRRGGLLGGPILRRVKVQSIDTATAKVLREYEIDGHFVRASPDGRFLLTAYAGQNPLIVMDSVTPLEPMGAWMVWDAATGKKRCDLTVAGQAAPSPTGGDFYWPSAFGQCALLTYSPDGRLLAWRQHGTETFITDLEAGKNIVRIKTPIGSIQFSRDGKTLACGEGKTVVLRETATGGVRARLSGHTADVMSLAFSPDGALLASGGQDAAVILWDAFGTERGTSATPNLAAAWDLLAQSDAGKAHEAGRTLGRHRTQAKAFLCKRIADYAERVQRECKPLVKALDSSVYAVRQQAQYKLREHGMFAAPALRAALEQQVSPELRRRLELLLHEMNGPAERVWLQVYRGLELLERWGAADALEDLSRDAASPVAAEARRCWSRLHHRR